MRRILMIAVAVSALGLAACDGGGGGGGSCEDICLEAQALSCTVIADCYEFCDVSRSLAAKAQCQAEYNALQSCSQNTPTCSIDSECSSEEDAFGVCLYPYCYANPSDADCLAAAGY
jgi:hypothetical protein